jgi:hypothetical protein
LTQFAQATRLSLIAFGSPGSSIRWPTISTFTIWRVLLRRFDWPGRASYLRRG